MTSVPTSISIGSVSSSISSALNSYRRVQYIIADSPFASSIEVPDLESNIEGETRQIPPPQASVTEVTENVPSHRNDDSFVTQFNWDEETDSIPRDRVAPHGKSYAPRHRRSTNLPARSSHRRENTPLLRALSSPSSRGSLSPVGQGSYQTYRSIVRPERRITSAPTQSAQPQFHVGQSTFGQSLFNTTAILLGIGVLSEPLAFAYTGWITGTTLLILYAFTSCYTAKILAGFIFSDPRVRTYADIGRIAFGSRSHIFISLLFCLELFSVCVLLVTIYGDSLHALFPQFPANAYKVIGAVFLIPTIFLPLSLLSYTSILGILSSTMLVVVVFIDGVSKPEAPGSLWDPAETSLGIPSPEKLAIAFGLFMAGFSGHSVIPSLARDMADPSQFNSMVNWAFIIATSIYMALGYVGYLMFGSDVSDEISKDLRRTEGYNPALNEAVLWVLVINPISKFALNMHPLYATLEIVLGFGHSSDAKMRVKGHSHQTSWGQKLLRIFLAISVVVISTIFPQFSAVMAFMGSFSAFTINVICPIAAKVATQGQCSILDGTIMVVNVVMTVWGTYAAFVPA